MVAPQVRSYSVRLLAKLGATAHATIPTLIAVLKEPNRSENVQNGLFHAVIEAISRIAPNTDSSERAIAALADVARSDDPVQRQWAVNALVHFESGATSAIPSLLEAVRKDARILVSSSPDGNTAFWLVAKISKVTPSAEEVILALADVVRSGTPMAQYEAAAALSLFGHDAAVVAPTLVELLKKTDSSDGDQPQIELIKSLGSIAAGTPSDVDAVKALGRFLDFEVGGHSLLVR